MYEYCNFGCAYFVIERTGERKEKQRIVVVAIKNNRSNAFVEEKSAPANKNSKPVIRTRKEEIKTTTPKQPSPKNLAKALRFVNVRSKQSEKDYQGYLIDLDGTIYLEKNQFQPENVLSSGYRKKICLFICNE